MMLFSYRKSQELLIYYFMSPEAPGPPRPYLDHGLGLFLKALFIGFQKTKFFENRTKIGRDRGDFLNLALAC